MAINTTTSKATTRQRAWQERQRAAGLKPTTIWTTDYEQFVLKRVLEQMRRTGGAPATFRNSKGQMTHFDL